MELISHSLTPWISPLGFGVWLRSVAPKAPIRHSVLYPQRVITKASRKAISGRTSYPPTRLEFLPYPQFIRVLFNERRFGPPEDVTLLSSWSWVDRRASGPRIHTNALFRLAFATAPLLQLNLACKRDSPAHSSIGTSSGINALWLIASIQFQSLFTPLPGFFSPFPHGTGSLSVTNEYLALRHGRRIFRQDIWPDVLWVSLRDVICIPTGLSPSVAGLPRSFEWNHKFYIAARNTTRRWFRLLRFRSPLLTEWIISVFSSRY